MRRRMRPAKKKEKKLRKFLILKTPATLYFDERVNRIFKIKRLKILESNHIEEN